MKKVRSKAPLRIGLAGGGYMFFIIDPLKKMSLIKTLM